MKNIEFFALIEKKYSEGYKKKITHLSENFQLNKFKSKYSILSNISLKGILLFKIKLFFSDSKIIYVRSIGERTFLLIPVFLILRFLKQKKIILEVPSPLSKIKYEKIKKTLKDKIYIILNDFFIKFLYFIVYKIIIYDYETYKYFLNKDKFILTSNAVDSRSYLFNKKKNKITNSFNLIFIGYLSNWHGIEKLMLSIYKYSQGKSKIFIKLDIYGVIEKNYKKKIFSLIKSLNLKSNITFHQPEYDTYKISKKFNSAHIGVGSLSLSQSKSFYRSELKIREYCAAGLPFIFKANDIDFNKFKFCLNLNFFELKIEDIIKWYNHLPENTPEIMHKYSISNLDYSIKVKYLIDQLKL